MKYFKKITLVVMISLSVNIAAMAQRATNGSYIQSGGLMFDQDIITPANMFEISQNQFAFGTARSMAMAGAFTSLGADLSSMSINPAGLGMYISSDISITPTMTFQRANTNAEAYGSNSRNKFSISNFGFATNIYQGKGNVISITMGMGYNKLQDLNYNYSFKQVGNTSSIADAFSKILDHSDLNANDLMGNNLNWNEMGADLWPAILGYKTGLSDYFTDDDGKNGVWKPDWIGGPGSGADIGHFSTVESLGSIGEYSLSFGMNISNKLYIGAALGLQSVYQEKNLYYSEDYYYSKPSVDNPQYGDAGIPFQLLYSHLNQTSIINGVGVNFKLGVTYRPIQNLRIGVAVHTPTYYSLDREYQGAAASNSFSNNPDYNPGENEFPKPNDNREIPLEAVSPQLIDSDEFGWSFTSPTKLLLGASYTFGRWGVLSVDYQRDWYNHMRLKDSPIGGQEDYKATMKSTFKGTNTLRVGLEVKPLPMVSLRGGFGYTGSSLQNEMTVLSSPITNSTTYYSAGIGFMLSRSTYLDFAYSYQTSKSTDYNLFYVDEYSSNNELLSSDVSDYFSTGIIRHNAILTFGVRF